MFILLLLAKMYKTITNNNFRGITTLYYNTVLIVKKKISFVRTVDSIGIEYIQYWYSNIVLCMVDFGNFVVDKEYCIVLMFFENVFLDYLTNLEKII